MHIHVPAPADQAGQRRAEVVPQATQLLVEQQDTFVDKRPEMAEGLQLRQFMNATRQAREAQAFQCMADASARANPQPLHAAMTAEAPRPNHTGLPDDLKSGIEALSGMGMDHVKVHYRSTKPAQLNAHAFAQGSEIHLASGQERHLPHEAWHVVQQAQGRVSATRQLKSGTPINDDPVLEQEADLMGARAATAQLQTGAMQPLAASRVQGAVQRAVVTGVQYLQNIVTANAADPEWDPQWTTALTRVANDAGFAVNVQDFDDAGEPSGVIGTLQALQPIGSLSSEKPNPYRLAVTAVRAHAGIESGSGGSGFGDLDTSPGGPISGRPAFPALTQQNVSVKSGQHRRHILAWHSIREFVSRAVAAKPGVVFGTIAGFVNHPPDAISFDVLNEAYHHVFKQREKSRSDATHLQEEDLLKIGLFVMNGNPRNLWAGKGTTNSAINTAQMHMEEALSQVTTFAGVEALAQKWTDSGAKVIYATATTLGAQLLMQRGTEIYSAWEHGGRVTSEASEVAKVVAAVRHYVVSNLQIDVLGDNAEQNKIVQEKHLALRDPIGVIDNVVTGAVPAAEVPDELIAMAIREFLTYAK